MPPRQLGPTGPSDAGAQARACRVRLASGRQGTTVSEPEPVARSAISAGELQQRALHGSSWTMAHVAIAIPLAFAANAVVARALGPSDYGQLAFLSASLSIAGSITGLGVTNASIQWGSAAFGRGDFEAMTSVVRRAVGYQVMVQAPVLLAFAVWMARGQAPWLVAALLLGVALQMVAAGPVLKITMESRSATNAKLQMAANAGLQGASVLTALLTHSAEALWAVRALLPGLSTLPYAAAFPRGRRRVLFLPKAPRHLGREFWAFALPTWVAGLVGMLVFSRSEIFALKGFGFSSALGIFSLAFGLSQQVTAPADSVLGPLGPATASLLASAPHRAREGLERAARLTGVLSGTVLSTVVPAVFFVIPLVYGQAFQEAAVAFLPLALVSCLQSATHPVVAFTRARRRGRLLLQANAAALGVDVAVMVIAVPRWGLWGALLANGMSQLVGIALLVRAEVTVQGISWRDAAAYSRPATISATTGGLGLAAGLALPQALVLARPLVSAFVGLLAFLVALRVLRAGLRAEDLTALRQVGGKLGALPTRLLGVMVTPS